MTDGRFRMGNLETRDIKQRSGIGVTSLLVLYGIALCLPSLYESGGGGPVGVGARWFYGFHCAGILPYVMVAPPWWANPCFFLGLVLLVSKVPQSAFWCGVLGTLLASGTFAMVWNGLTGWVGMFQGGTPHTFPLGPGFFAWLGCMLGLTWMGRAASLRDAQESSAVENPAPPVASSR
jgi:hypothetical protein